MVDTGDVVTVNFFYRNRWNMKHKTHYTGLHTTCLNWSTQMWMKYTRFKIMDVIGNRTSLCETYSCYTLPVYLISVSGAVDLSPLYGVWYLPCTISHLQIHFSKYKSLLKMLTSLVCRQIKCNNVWFNIMVQYYVELHQETKIFNFAKACFGFFDTVRIFHDHYYHYMNAIQYHAI